MYEAKEEQGEVPSLGVKFPRASSNVVKTEHPLDDHALCKQATDVLQQRFGAAAHQLLSLATKHTSATRLQRLPPGATRGCAVPLAWP